MDSPELDSPYSPPETHILAKASEPYIPHVFSLTGRIGRARYLCYSIWVTLLVAFLGSVMGSFVVVFLSGFDEAVMMNYALIGGMLLYVPLFSVFFVMAKRRLNDLDVAGWWGLLVFVPLINIGLTFFLTFWRGSKHANRFGPPPAENSLLVIIFGVVIPILGSLLILLVISLPALIGYGFSLQPELLDGL